MLTITACWSHGCRIFASLYDGRTVACIREFDTPDAARKIAGEVGDFGSIHTVAWREVD